jgi:hypothetical protein
MKTRYILLGQIALSVLISTLFSCSDDGFIENSNGQLKKIKNGGYIVEEISYNQDSRVLEVKSTMFYRKFHYDTDLKLIKEEVAISPIVIVLHLHLFQHMNLLTPKKQVFQCTLYLNMILLVGFQEN